MSNIIATIHALGEAQKEIVASVKKLKNSIPKLSEKASNKDCTPREKASQEESAAAPSYPTSVLHMPYLKGYETPNLVLFDRRKGSPKEHISPFIDALGPHTGDCNLCLKKFSKSLIDSTVENGKCRLPETNILAYIPPQCCEVMILDGCVVYSFRGPDHIMWENPEYGDTACQASEVPKETKDMSALATEDESLYKIMLASKFMQDGSIIVAEKLR
ncbi:hypothetical protein D8674_013790 [Pyrus ussuriensis x Pyrus communis]|uniref:Uncharacterized protein n=1 Tax=Pyrus ussuriensis x Pyrus communis TaxID=2448454 RepID=A0A5N5GVI2_9ROSA|nr:hypothetical protein D8674_013790 [Pyrus ussuriensis x Pyrus communis]